MATLGKYYLVRFMSKWESSTGTSNIKISEINEFLEKTEDRLVETNFYTRGQNRVYCVLTMYRRDEDET